MSDLTPHAGFLRQSWRTLIDAFPPVDAAAEAAAFERWGQDTAAALQREEPALRAVAAKAFWAALLEAAAAEGLRPETEASLRRRLAAL